jgi:hypothetical protein
MAADFGGRLPYFLGKYRHFVRLDPPVMKSRPNGDFDARFAERPGSSSSIQQGARLLLG